MRKLKLDEFIKYKFLSGIKLSPNSRYAGFAVHESNLEENKYHSNLWLYDMETRNALRLTTFNKEADFIWHSDGNHMIFSTLRDPQDQKRAEEGESLTQFYRINIQGGEAQKYFSIPLKVTEIAEGQEGSFIFTAIDGPMEKDLSQLTQEERSQELKKRKEEQDYEVVEEIPFWGNGQGFTNKKRNRLYTYDLTNNQYRVLSKEGHNVTSFSLNEGKNQVAYISESFEGVASLTSEICLYDLTTAEAKTLLKEGQFSCDYCSFINDDQLVFIGTEMKHYGINENRLFYRLDLNNGEINCLTPSLDMSLHGSVGTDIRFGSSKPYQVDGEYLYFITTELNSAQLNRLHLKEGTLERLTSSSGSIDGYTVKDDEILLIALRGLKPQELYQLQGEREVQLTHFNQWVVDEIQLVEPQALSFETAPGITIDGWVMKPVDFDESKKYPAILDIHGGPKTVYGEVYYHEMQYWANEGYFVFFCNPRGSDGKGNDFADIRGKYGTIDYEDIMKFTDEVLRQYPNIDQDRVGVTGGSYGGFMTNWIIGHTDRFKAAASQRSISNWISKFGTTDIGFFFVDDQQGGTPWNNHDKLWWHSPLKYADQVKTPTLFIHSDEDYRCWMTEVYQMFTALKYHGIDSRLCIFRGENHELSRSGKPKHRTRRLEEITSWFNRYLKE